MVGILLMPAQLFAAPCGLGGGRSQRLSILVGSVDVGGVLAMPIPSHTHTHFVEVIVQCSSCFFSFLFSDVYFFLQCFVLLFAFALFL